MTFFREIKARWRSKMPLFWAKVNRVALWLSGLQAVFLPILMDDSISQHLHPYLIEALKGGLTISVTAALLSKLTIPNAAQLEEKESQGDKNNVLHSKNINRGKGAAILLLLLALPSCVTYQKCVDKFGATVKDTLRVPVEVVVPKDSISVTFRHDTLKTYQTIIERQGRATVIIEKMQDVYKVQAECDSIIIRDTVQITYEKIIMKPHAPSWWKVWQNFALLGLAGLLIWAVVRR